MSSERMVGGTPRSRGEIAAIHGLRRWTTKRRAYIWATAIVVFCGLAALVTTAWRARPALSVRNGVGTIPVGLGVAARGDLRIMIAALGTITPLTTVSVKSQISGRVTQIGFQEGQLVEEGDFLAEIDPRPYTHALRQARGQLMRDKALLENARLDLERYARLVKQNSISRQQLDTQVSLVRQYEGAVEIDEGNVEIAELNLAYCRISAPVSGRVGLRQADLGNYVQAGVESIVVLTQLQPISVVFPIAEDHLPAVMGKIRAGKRLPVTIYDRSGRRGLAEGTLTSLDSQVDPTTGTVKFKAELENRDLSLFPNQFVNARLLVETLHDATVIPTAGVRYGPKGPFAFVVSEDGAARARAIELGPAEGEKMSVLSGLSSGERIVIAGADRLRDGAKVKAVEE
ncbi:MAG: multidrug transporter subunit MdtA [Methylocystaceae bacterium]|nr:MAG: multidrug transporter subunit MdtA [Methylocystaceae bacterium]